MSNALTLPFSPGTALTDFRKALACVPPAVLQGVMAAAMLCALAPSAISAVQHARADAEVTAPAASSPGTPAAGARARCLGCGFVQSIRHIEAAGLVPAAYELTVRMRDGSLRTSSHSSAGTWLVGDRIMLVGGVQVAAISP
jgi:hypothetical protein